LETGGDARRPKGEAGGGSGGRTPVLSEMGDEGKAKVGVERAGIGVPAGIAGVAGRRSGCGVRGRSGRKGYRCC